MYGKGSVSASGPGMSPRKQMAAGGGGGGDFGVGSYPGMGGKGRGSSGGSFGVTGYPGTGKKAHPERAMPMNKTMDDAGRGIGMPVSRSSDHHPSQAAPDHGPGMKGRMGHRY